MSDGGTFTVVQQRGRGGAVDSLRAILKAGDLAHDPSRPSDGRDAGDEWGEGEGGQYRPSAGGSLLPVSLVRSFYELSALDVDGRMLSFARLEGRVTLVVNVATGDEKAGGEFTQMNELVSSYDGRGFSILAFPCNQFGSREPWRDHEIPLCLQHVRPGRGFAPKFHLMGGCDVNGPRAHPVFEYLTQRLPTCSDDGATIRSLRGRLLPPRSPDVRWNFEKFLIGHDGRPYKRFSSRTPVRATAGEVEDLLRRSNVAMQSASRPGANKFVRYDPSQEQPHKSKKPQRALSYE